MSIMLIKPSRAVVFCLFFFFGGGGGGLNMTNMEDLSSGQLSIQSSFTKSQRKNWTKIMLLCIY